MASSSTISTLTTYDSIIGVGLGSNSPAQAPDVPQQRARHLCGALSAMMPSNSDTPVFGLSIGEFRGGPVDTRQSQQRDQRPILIAGVERKSPSLDEEALLLEMMMSFDYSGINLQQYSALATGGQAHWYRIEECDPSTISFGPRQLKQFPIPFFPRSLRGPPPPKVECCRASSRGFRRPWCAGCAGPWRRGGGLSGA